MSGIKEHILNCSKDNQKMFIKSAIEEYNQPVLWQLQEIIDTDPRWEEGETAEFIAKNIQRVMIENEDEEDLKAGLRWPGTAGRGQ